MVSQSRWRQPRCVHWQAGVHPNTWATAVARLSEALSARGHARGSQGGSQKGTGQRRLWPCHWSCCRLLRSGNIPHRTRNHWMRRASRARLQLPRRDLKKPNQNKILQISIIWSDFVERLGLEPLWFGVVGSLWGLVCSSGRKEARRAIDPSPWPTAENGAGIPCSRCTRTDRVG